MRYVNKQQHKASCGPVAVINALKWLGCSVNYRDSLDIFKVLGYHENGGGTWKSGVINMLRFFKIRFEFKDRIKVRDIEKAIDDGYSVVLSYRWYENNKYGNHLVFIDKYTDKLIKSKNERFNGGDYGAKKSEYKRWFARSKKEGKDSGKGPRPRMFIIKGIK